MLHPQESGRLDAKRHYVISAKLKRKMVFSQLAMPVQCCASAPAAAAPQHSSARGHMHTEGYDTAQHGIIEA